MKKEFDYQRSFGRVDYVSQFIYGLFSLFISYPRLLLEVFIRKDFGERYFKLSSALTVALFLAVYPYLGTWLKMWAYGKHAKRMIAADTENAPSYFLWYVFILAFVAVSIWHFIYNLHHPGVFDLAKYSLSSGRIHRRFYAVKLPFIATSRRIVECLLEPAFFFAISLPLYLFGDPLGGLILVCSILYAGGYLADYNHGDNYVMSLIDNMLLAEALERVFLVDGAEQNGVQFPFRRPNSEEMRRRLLPHMVDDDFMVAE